MTWPLYRPCRGRDWPPGEWLPLLWLLWHHSSMPRVATTHSMVTWPFFEAARRLGLPVDAGRTFLHSNAAPGEAAGRVTHGVANDMLQWGVEMSGRPDLGILAAQAVEPGHFDLVELASRSQATVEEGLATLASLLPLLHDGLRVELQRGTATSRISLRLAPGQVLHPAGFDFIAATLFIAGCRQTGRSTLPMVSLQFPYPEPDDHAYLDAFFGTQLLFDGEALQAVFPSELLGLALVRSDGKVGKLLEEAAKGLLPQDPEQRFLSQVQALLRESLQQGATLAAVAKRLHLSERTLRRRLTECGVSFRELVDGARHEAALALLADPNRSTEAVADALGFTTSQAFHRAFRRWTGTTVQAYRTARGAK